MAKSANLAESYSDHVAGLPGETRLAIEYLEKLILSVSPEFAAHIKWNSPAFYYTGPLKTENPKTYPRDVLVMNLRAGRILCVLPTGSRVQVNVELLEGNYSDGRRMILFKDLNDIRLKAEALKRLLGEWLSLLERP